MPAHNLRRFLASALAFGALSLPAGASVMQTASFEEKVDKAASVILGKCVRQESRWDSQKRWILTYSTFAVEKAMKGSVAGEITIVTPGGSIGEIHQDTIGVPQFEVGTEKVLFVKNTSAGPTVLYFDQGAYDVVADDRGRRIVAPMATDAVTVDETRGKGVAAEAARPVEEFETAVRQAERSVKQRVEMDLVASREAAERENSLTSVLLRNRALVALALAGLALATWQFMRRG
jgi:hypothetical protein